MMSKSASKGRPRSGGGGGHSSSKGAARRISDVGPYVGFAIIWLFVSFLAYLTAREVWVVIAAGFAAAFALYVTACTARAWLGRPLAFWQKGLVRLPLMMVGAGRVPVSLVKGDKRARLASAICLVVSLLLIAATVWLMLRA